MILIYPALVSETIPPDYMPAICKMLEDYIITYVQDDMFNKLRTKSRKQAMAALRESYIFPSKEDMISESNVGANFRKPPDFSFDSLEAAVKQTGNTSMLADLRDEERKSKYIANSNNVPWKDVWERRQKEAWELASKQDKEDYERDYQEKMAKLKRGELGFKGKEYILSKRKIENDRLLKRAELNLKGREYIMKKQQLQKDRATARVSTIQLSTDMALKPTSIQVDTMEGTMVVGIKVVPFYISGGKSANMTELLLNDRNLSGIKSKIVGFTRLLKKSILNIFYKVTKLIPLVPGKPSTMTGNVETDVLLSLTDFKGRVFVIIDKNELDSEFFQEAGGVKRLFRLGWGNLVFIDDVNKRAHFCMKKFKGMCSVIPFSTMYSSLGGREQLYNSIEAARSASNPFFSVKRSSKMFTENNEYMLKKLDKYKSITENRSDENSEILDESFLSDLISRFSGKKNLVNDIVEKGKKGDIKGIKNISQKLRLKKVTPDNIKNYAAKKNPKYDECYKFSEKVLENSLENLRNEYVRKMMSNCIAASSILLSLKQKTSPILETKNLLKSIVPKMQLIEIDLKDKESVKGLEKLIESFIKLLLAITGISVILFVPGIFTWILVLCIASIFVYWSTEKSDAGNI